MDVRSCQSRDHRREANGQAWDRVDLFLRAPPQRASGESFFLLTEDSVDNHTSLCVAR
jgi:hypothetical protein